jgi:hypothetical protein
MEIFLLFFKRSLRHFCFFTVSYTAITVRKLSCSLAASFSAAIKAILTTADTTN